MGNGTIVSIPMLSYRGGSLSMGVRRKSPHATATTRRSAARKNRPDDPTTVWDAQRRILHDAPPHSPRDALPIAAHSATTRRQSSTSSQSSTSHVRCRCGRPKVAGDQAKSFVRGSSRCRKDDHSAPGHAVVATLVVVTAVTVQQGGGPGRRRKRQTLDGSSPNLGGGTSTSGCSIGSDTNVPIVGGRGWTHCGISNKG